MSLEVVGPRREGVRVAVFEPEEREHVDGRGTGLIALIPQDPERIAYPGGVGADELHCSLKFLGRTSNYSDGDRREIEEGIHRLLKWDWDWVSWMMVRGVDRFGHDEVDAIELIPDEHDRELRSLVCRLPVVCEIPDTWPEWRPHITISSEETPDEFEKSLPSVVAFDRIRLYWGEEMVDFLL